MHPSKRFTVLAALLAAGQCLAAEQPAQPAAARAGASNRRCTSTTIDEPAHVTLGKSTVIPLTVPMVRILVSGQAPGGFPPPGAAMPGGPAPGQMAAQAPAYQAPAGSNMQASDGIADMDVMLLSPTDLFFRGKKSGAMNVIMQNAQGACFIKDVFVTIDPDALQLKLSELMPEETGIRVHGAENALVLTGEVSNSLRLNEVVMLASSYGDGRKVINMLHTNAPQQVMLEVKIAEVSKTLLDQLGSSIVASRPSTGGLNTYSIVSNFLIQGAGGLAQAMRIGRATVNLNGEKDDGLVRILAEPNIMAISGQQASFLSGGKIFIPVSQANSVGVPTITLEEKEFGVGVKFTPTVLSGNSVSLKMVSEVSELSQTGSPFTTVNGVTAVLPSMTVRRADTTVQLSDGQSLVVAGLIRSEITETVKRFPGLGEVPVVGALARSTEFAHDQTELLFVITPHLVQPLAQAPRLPTDNHVLPSRAEVYLNGALESSTPPADDPPPPAAATSAPAELKSQEPPP